MENKKTLSKEEKIKALEKAMIKSDRSDEIGFYHFTDEAPKELVDLFIKHYAIDNVDYQIFEAACSIVWEVVTSADRDDTDEKIADDIEERADDVASVYTSDRLGYLNIWNQRDISDIFREYDCEDISDACAIWYSQRVQQAAAIINDWINA